ncbi:hypothetical protein PBI_THONKO_65 [Mycobacterium phage Thonko]|uniref:DUF7423 domain-containing protein n=1 Tax=Mycobacterium phage Thonko TaxID=2282910 RepID=A0A346FCB2_9CAUD|nr:hypothetical protein I5G57_gp065 [Mycobacterium phage Thonko]AXN53337.1 hypothetical protein PBI_THONKO_65 [Mycobacterium phage Thonko]
MTTDSPDLTAQSTASIALVLGFCAAVPGAANIDVARIVLMVEELQRRGEWDSLLADLDYGLARRLTLLAQMSRGQVWARSGVRRPSSDNSPEQRQLR